MEEGPQFDIKSAHLEEMVEWLKSMRQEAAKVDTEKMPPMQPKSLRDFSVTTVVKEQEDLDDTVINLPATLVQQTWDELVRQFTGKILSNRSKSIDLPLKMLRALLETRQLKSFRLQSWMHELGILKEIPHLHKLESLECDSFGVAACLPSVQNELNSIGSLERLKNLKVLKLPRLFINFKILRGLKNIKVIDTCVDEKEFSENVQQLRELEHLLQLRLGVANCVPGDLAALELAQLVTQLPALQKVDFHTMMTSQGGLDHTPSLSVQFVAAVGESLKDRLRPILVQSIEMDEVRKMQLRWPKGLTMQFSFLDGPLDEWALQLLQMLTPDSAYATLSLRNIQPAFLYGLVEKFGAKVKKCILWYDDKSLNQAWWNVEPLVLHRVLATLPSLSKFALRAPKLRRITTPSVEDLDAINFQNFESFTVHQREFGIEYEGDALSRLFVAFLSRSKKIETLKLRDYGLLSATLDALKRNPVWCTSVKELSISVESPSAMFDMIAEVAARMLTRAFSLIDIEVESLTEEDEEYADDYENVQKLLSGPYKWFNDMLREIGVDFCVI